MAQFNPLFLDTGSIEVIPNSRNSVVDFIHFPTTGSNSIIYTTLLPDPYLVASQSAVISNAVNTTSSSLYRYNIPNRVEDYFYSTNAIIGVSTTVTTTGVRIGLQLSQNANTAFNIKSPSTLTAFTFACVGTEDSTIFVLPAGHAAINTIYPTHVRGLTSNILTSPTSNISNTFLLQPETNNSVTSATGSVFYNQFAGFFSSGIDSFIPAIPASGFNISFNSGEIIQQPDDKILVGGNFTSYIGTSQNNITRLNIDGTRDTSFNIGTGFSHTSFSSFVTSIQLQSDGKIIVGGFFDAYSGSTQNCLVRLNSDGTLDNSFNIGSGFNADVRSIAIQPDGKIIAGGFFGAYSGSTRNGIVRLNTNGTIDTSFTVGSGFSPAGVYSVKLQPDGKILVAGTFNSYAGTSQSRITRLNSNGTRDTSFNVGGGFTGVVANPAIPLSDGKVLVVGDFTAYSGSSVNRIVRLNASGTIDTSFNVGTGFNIIAYDAYEQPDGKILVGGNFTSYSGSTINRFVRLNTNGTIDTSLDVGSGFDSAVVKINQQYDQKILAIGTFTTYKGISATYGTRLYESPSATLSPLYLLSGSLKAISGSDTVTSTFLPATSSLWISQSLTANVSNSSNTVYATVFDTTGLVTGQRYLANVYIAARTAATTTGFRMRVQNGTEYRGSIIIPTSATAVSIQNSANGTNITNAVPTAAPAGTFLAYGEYTFVKGAANPQVQILSEINTSFVTAGTGSVVFYRPITH